jgi:hypothetical protein
MQVTIKEGGEELYIADRKTKPKTRNTHLPPSLSGSPRESQSIDKSQIPSSPSTAQASHTVYIRRTDTTLATIAIYIGCTSLKRCLPFNKRKSSTTCECEGLSVPRRVSSIFGECVCVCLASTRLSGWMGECRVDGARMAQVPRHSLIRVISHDGQ